MLDDDMLATHRQELRRGSVVLACLLVLRNPDYGYALLEALDARGFAVDANTLYPLLRRLEAQGLLTSEWNTEESRPASFTALATTAPPWPTFSLATGSSCSPPLPPLRTNHDHDPH